MSWTLVFKSIGVLVVIPILTACGATMVPQQGSKLTSSADPNPQEVPADNELQEVKVDPNSVMVRGDLEKWFASEIPRGRDRTLGDFSLKIFGQTNRLPWLSPKGFYAIICGGAGCQVKLRFEYTAAHLQTIENEMSAARSKNNCNEDTPACELVALKAAMVAFEMIVYQQKLAKMPADELRAYSVYDDANYGKRLIQDCVDQASNGVSYLYILAHLGHLKHHKIIYPGQENLAIVQPHFFTRLQSPDGKILKFDLYHRGRFGIPPYVTCIERC